jgi:hypothetical protein
MTKREAAIVSAYTGILIGGIKEMHDYIEELLGRPVLTHQLANEFIVSDIKERAKKDFLKIEVTE